MGIAGAHIISRSIFKGVFGGFCFIGLLDATKSDGLMGCRYIDSVLDFESHHE